ncbi:MAG: hypothetical protein OIF40_01115 [Mangrovicoccus sp.]|nr:hypothetical protein [Mangrovicoccus sp.]
MEYLLILLGAIVAGFFGAGLVLIINLFVGKRLPKWSMAVAAGIAMLSMTLYLEYDWFDRRSAELPEGIEVVWHNGQKQIWRPWTYVFPLTTRFIAMDTVNIGSNEHRPELRLVDMLFVQRWTRDRLNKVIFDCDLDQSAVITPQTIFGTDGAVEGADWDPVDPNDPVAIAACKGRESHAGERS